MFDVNKNKGFLIVLGVALVLVIVGLVLWRGAVGSAREAEAELYSYESDYESVVGTYGGEPTGELVARYAADTEALNAAAGKLRAALPAAELPTFTPNGFKDEVKTLQNRFYALSGEKNIPIPQDIGEAQWLGPDMPSEAELPTLIRQLVTIRDVLTVLMEMEVAEVNTIDRNPQGMMEEAADIIDIDIVFPDADEGPAARTARTAEEAAGQESAYSAVPVMFNFRASPGTLPQILVAIRNSPQFYRIRSINTTSEIEALGELQDPADVEELLAVEMVVDHIVVADVPGSSAL